MKASGPSPFTLDLFSGDDAAVDRLASLTWPDGRRFPLNAAGEQVYDRVVADLAGAASPLLITGYASLDHLVDFVAGCPERAVPRLLLGSEPYPSGRGTYRLVGRELPAEIEEYWLERGVSPRLSAKLLVAIERLESGSVQARYLPGRRRLHAKIYLGDDGATVGSSNFTEPGLRRHIEANARFGADTDKRRYRELGTIAENLWSVGLDYADQLIALLKSLLAVVTWQEALARACGELLEGEWAEAYLGRIHLAQGDSLWPSQRQGIAQALYILSQQGSVLIADPTGSGKTRMGVHLIGSIHEQIVRKGRLRQGNAIMVCPPMVEGDWQWEAVEAGVPLDIVSHGKLSHRRSRRHAVTVEALRRAQIVCVDEGHNFLNFQSQRTQHVLRNMADHVALFTATPINKSVTDLLRIADMLGADNLEPATLNAFKTMLGVKRLNRSLTEEEIGALRKEIQKFTVRRTKAVLNKLIEREPERYVDKTGRPCRFPRHEPRTYALDEPAGDRRLAAEIRALAERLHGVTHFIKPLEMPEVLRRGGVTEAQFLQGRLRSARRLAGYVIMSSLRSSRAALLEHLIGTAAAVKALDVSEFRKATVTGDMLGQLEAIAGRPPESRLSTPLPDWLTDPAAHAEACRQDRAVLAAIRDRVLALSDHRERRKADHLLRLVKSHALVLAFDSRPITLAVVRQRLRARSKTVQVIVATGDASSQRGDVLDAFRLGSERRRTVGLCSDSLSEGVNLQQASVIVHLDMPTVVRIAEQRAGRVDRLDSPHEVIEAWWPDDAPEFALTTDDRFIERFETVESLLGSNMPLPETLQRDSKPLDAARVIEELERESAREPWDGIRDAFEPVRRLVDGDDPLLPPSLYDQLRQRHARVVSRVSVVRASAAWAFFCLRGTTFGAPRWLLMPAVDEPPVTDLDEICRGLRERLSPDTGSGSLDPAAADALLRFLDRLDSVERQLLPRRKLRALEEMGIITAKLAEGAGQRGDQSAVKHLARLRDLLQGEASGDSPDWDELAGRWLDVIRPVWFDLLKQPRRRKPLLIRDVRQALLAREEWLTAQILEQFRTLPSLQRPEERVQACIIGVPE